MNPWIEDTPHAALLAAGAAGGWLVGQRVRPHRLSAAGMAIVLAAAILGRRLRV